MDGSRGLRWLALGCVVAGAVGCNRNSVQPGPVGPMPGTLPGPAAPAKSMWGGSAAPPPAPVALEPPPSNKPASAEALVAFADVRLDAAFDEKTPPGNKEALLDMAREGYQKALKQEPKSPPALLGLARFYAKVGEREKAVDGYKRYLTAYPQDAKVAQEVAIAHARWKDWAGACAWCEFGLKIDPENRDLRKTHGFCLARAGKWEQALESLRQVMPEAQARHNIAGMLDHMGHAEHSRVHLQLAVQADPAYAPARDFLAELSQPPADPNAVRQASDQQPAP